MNRISKSFDQFLHSVVTSSCYNQHFRISILPPISLTNRHFLISALPSPNSKTAFYPCPSVAEKLSVTDRPM